MLWLSVFKQASDDWFKYKANPSAYQAGKHSKDVYDWVRSTNGTFDLVVEVVADILGIDDDTVVRDAIIKWIGEKP